MYKSCSPCLSNIHLIVETGSINMSRNNIVFITLILSYFTYVICEIPEYWNDQDPEETCRPRFKAFLTQVHDQSNQQVRILHKFLDTEYRVSQQVWDLIIYAYRGYLLIPHFLGTIEPWIPHHGKNFWYSRYLRYFINTSFFPFQLKYFKIRYLRNDTKYKYDWYPLDTALCHH